MSLRPLSLLPLLSAAALGMTAPDTLPPTRVTATRDTPAAAPARGGASAHVDAAAPEHAAAITLGDTLSGTPGLDVSRRSATDAPTLSIRGSGSNDKTGNGRGIVIIRDGLPMNQADGLMELTPVDPATLDVIEVWRGANALRYGANSLGGAILLRSKTGITSPGLSISASGGSYGYAKTFASAGAADSDSDGYAAYSFTRADGYRDQSATRAHRFLANATRALPKGWENQVHLSATDFFAEKPGDITRAELSVAPRSAAPAAVTFETYRAYRLAQIGDTLAYDDPGHHIVFTLGHSNRDLDEHGSDSVTDKITNITAFSGLWRTKNPSASTLGFNLATGTVHDNRFRPLPGTSTRGPKRQSSEQLAHTAEAFAEQDLRFTSADVFTLGFQSLWTTRSLHYTSGQPLSENRDREYLALNPKLGLRHEFSPDTAVFASLCRSYEAPTFGQFKTSRADQPANLAAQRAWTAELGARGAFRRAGWDVALYHSEVKDEFLAYTSGAAATDPITRNAPHTRHAGLEAAIDLELLSELPAGATLRTHSPHTRLLLRNSGNLGDHRFVDDPLFGSRRLAGTSLYRHRVELRFEHRRGFYLAPHLETATAPFIDSANTFRAPAYAMLGLRAGVPVTRTARLFFEARNITDERVSPTVATLADAGGLDRPVFRPADGRSAYAGLELRF